LFNGANLNDEVVILDADFIFDSITFDLFAFPQSTAPFERFASCVMHSGPTLVRVDGAAHRFPWPLGW